MQLNQATRSLDKACGKYCMKYVDGFEQAIFEHDVDSLYKACK